MECYFGKLVFTSGILATSVFTSGILAILSTKKIDYFFLLFLLLLTCFLFKLAESVDYITE